MDWRLILNSVWPTAIHLIPPGFSPLNILCFEVILVGYGTIWPKGAKTHDRSLNLMAVTLFGLLWGAGEGTLFVSGWLLTSRLIVWRWLIIFVTFFLSTLIGLWHASFGDIFNTPKHNIAAWNGCKVRLIHIPNLALTLTHLALNQMVKTNGAKA